MEASRPFDEVEIFTGEVREVHPTQVPPLPMMRSQTEYHTAVSVQRPRNLDKVVAAVKREAALAGEAFYWSWPVKNKKTGKMETLSGPSISLAMCVAREWTNVAVPVDYTETTTHDIFTAHFVDLERGFTVSRIWKQAKGANRHLDAWGDRAVAMTFQAAQSRAIRNAVLAGVPRWLIDQAKDIAMEAVLKGITPEKIAAARDGAIKVFAARGVTEERLVAALGVPKAQWGPDEIVNLKGMLSQIKDGQATADELFPEVQGPKEPEAPEKPKKHKRTRKASSPEPAGEAITQGPGPNPSPESDVSAPPPEAGAAPSVDELLEILAAKNWPLPKLEVFFAAKRSEWGPDHVKKLADMAMAE